MSTGNDEQRTFWEGFAALWVARQAELDAAFSPVLDDVLARASLVSGYRVLDIGCGTGTSTLRAAGIVGDQGHVTGADISEPMLIRARETAAGRSDVHFLTADVAEHRFDGAGFDAVISRYGTMFFADSVAAFKNIRGAMKPGARLVMACWGGLEDNPWFRVPMYAAKARLGAPPAVDPDAPGPLAFRDIDRVTGILESAGFADVRGVCEQLFLTPRGSLKEVARQATSIGPAARATEHFGADDADFEAIAAMVEEGFAGYVSQDGVRVPAGINFFEATAP